jgi:ABC-type transporter Mla MlaB component
MKKRPGSHHYMLLQEDAGKPVLILSGDWTVYNAAAIEDEIDNFLAEVKSDSLTINAEKITIIDTAGAWLIKKHFADQAGLNHITPQQEALLDFLPAKLKTLPKRSAPSGVFLFFQKIGAFVILGLQFIYALLVFIGKIRPVAKVRGFPVNL